MFCQEESVKLLKWAWTHLYLASVETGLVLPTEFYNDLTAMLSGRKNITKLIEVLLYTSLLPILSPSLYSLADILQISTDSPKTLLFNHSNVVLFAQVTTLGLCSQLKSPSFSDSLQNLLRGLAQAAQHDGHQARLGASRQQPRPR